MKKIRYYLEYLAVKSIGIFVQLLPVKWSISFGARLGDFVYYFLPIRKNIALKNLEIAFGKEKSKKEIKNICRECYRNLGRSLIEFLRFPKYTKENIFKFVTMENEEHLKTAFEKGKGVIIIAAHFGNWELSAAAVALRGYPLSQVSKDLHNYFLNRIVLEYRGDKNIKVIGLKMEVREIIKALKQNNAVGVADDQEARLHGAWVDFMGREALTAKGPVLLAKKLGSELVPCFIVRQKDKITHKLFFEKPIKIDYLSEKADNKKNENDEMVRKCLLEFNKTLEMYVRKFPEQYFWLHNRWRTNKLNDCLSRLCTQEHGSQ